MIYTYILIVLIVFIIFFKYTKKLKKENLKLKSQIEEKKCSNFNLNISTDIQKQKEIEMRKYKILEFLTKYETITNDQVENLFKVSNSTAYRILEDLEREGKIEQIGNTGRNVYYILNRFKK